MLRWLSKIHPCQRRLYFFVKREREKKKQTQGVIFQGRKLGSKERHQDRFSTLQSGLVVVYFLWPKVCGLDSNYNFGILAFSKKVDSSSVLESEITQCFSLHILSFVIQLVTKSYSKHTFAMVQNICYMTLFHWFFKKNHEYLFQKLFRILTI